MFLVDTNVWLELLLEQASSDEARDFLRNTDARLLAITEFSLYSIGIALTRLNKDSVFEDFVSDVLENSGVARIRLETPRLRHLLAVRRQFGLDFDDAYQYVAATSYGYTLVSFDSDFDRTDLERKTPAQVA